MPEKPEKRARQTIDQLLAAAGWRVLGELRGSLRELLARRFEIVGDLAAIGCHELLTVHPAAALKATSARCESGFKREET